MRKKQDEEVVFVKRLPLYYCVLPANKRSKQRGRRGGRRRQRRGGRREGSEAAAEGVGGGSGGGGSKPEDREQSRKCSDSLSEKINVLARNKNTQTHLWAKLGEECTGKGSEGIGPSDRTSR